MSNTYKEIVSAALELPPDSRAMLVEELLSSLDATAQTKIDAAWRAEIERRLREIAEGKAKLIPGEQVMAELHSRLER